MQTIALLTDFGYGEYVGIMKGNILRHCSKNINIIDITHSIEPQNILQASWILSTSIPYFPKGTVFVCVVDPGVGGQRNSILIKTKECILIGPNNGIFTHSFLKLNLHIETIFILNTSESLKTFQGRDVFCKNAATLIENNIIDGFENKDENIYFLKNENELKNKIQIVSID